MSAVERVCRWSMLVAWLWATFASVALARPQHAALALRSSVSMVPTFANVSTPLSPEPVNGNCGKCGIEAPGGIRLVYWEPDNAVVNSTNITLAQDYAQTYTQVQDGFTYTSPSVYVIYSSLRATATCSDSALHTVGPSFAEKTIAYSSRFLAYGTLSMPDGGCSEHVVVGGFHTIDFSSLYYNPITTTTTFKAGCEPYVNPRLSLPAQLTSVDPAWQDCEPLFYGAFDPPSILRKVSGGLVPSPVGAGLTTDPATPQAVPDSNPAQPIVTPAPPIATQTDGFKSGDTQPSQVGNAPVEGSPGGGSRPSPIVDPGPYDPTQYSISADNEKISQGDSQFAVPTANAVLPVPASNNQKAPADGFGPAQPDNNGAAGGNPPSGYSMVHLNAGAFVAVPGAPGSPSSVAVASGDYLIPQPTTNQEVNVPQQALTLQGGVVTTVPVMPPPPAVTLQNGQITIIPADAPHQTVTLQGGVVSAISPTPLTALTLSNGQVTNIPIADPASSNDNNAPVIPQQILTLKGGEVTTVPIDPLPQTLTLQGGEVTSIPADAPQQAITLQGGVVSTISPAPYTTLTLSNGQMTTVPVANLAFSNSNSAPVIPQQILTLKGGEVTTVPVDPLPQTFTMQGGVVTTIPADASQQAITLQGGAISTISSTPYTTLTLSNGQVTTVPIGNTISSNGGSVAAMPQQILTLKGGEVTTVPIDLPPQTLTLQGGKVTTIPTGGPPQTVTLANGQVTTLSAVPHTTVTLADGEVTSIPIGNPALAGEEGGSVLVPDATITGKVHYTRLPTVMIKNTGNGSSSIVNGTGVPDLASATGTASLTNDGIPQGNLAGLTGSITQGGASASGKKTSGADRLAHISGWLFGLVVFTCMW